MLLLQTGLVVLVLAWMFRSLQSVFQLVVVLAVLHIYVFYWLVPEWQRLQASQPPTPIVVAPSVWSVQGFLGRLANGTLFKKEL